MSASALVTCSSRWAQAWLTSCRLGEACLADPEARVRELGHVRLPRRGDRFDLGDAFGEIFVRRFKAAAQNRGSGHSKLIAEALGGTMFRERIHGQSPRERPVRRSANEALSYGP